MPVRASLIALTFLVAGCAAPPPPAPAPAAIAIGIVGEPGSLLADDPSARAIAALVVEPLVRRTSTEELEPRLAEAVPTLENGGAEMVEDGGEARLVATFRLRQGAVWHDGAPIGAEDVRFAFEEDRIAPRGTDARAMADRIERVEVVDERTVRVTYRPGERWDLFALAPRALPRHLLSGASPARRSELDRRPVHAGPYRIEDRTAAVIVLVAFPGHVIDRPGIERIVVRAFPDRAAVLAALRRGEIDLAPFPTLEADLARTLDRSADGSSLQVFYTQAQAVAMLRLGPSFAGPEVRRAIALAIDREGIARSVFSGRVRVPESYLVPPLWAATETVPAGASDRAAARTVLAGAVAVPRAATILVPSGSPALEAAGRLVARDLGAIGIAARVRPAPPGEISERVRRGDLDLAIVPEVADDPLAATERYRGAVSTWFDVLADAARAVGDRSEQRELYAELQRLWSATAPAVPLFQVLKVDVALARLEGVRPASHGAPITWNAAEWRIATE